MTQQTAEPRPRHERAGETILPRRPFEFPDAATRIGTLRGSPRSRAAAEHAQGTGPNSTADPEAPSGILDRLKRSIPDPVPVHGNRPGVERTTGEWARNGRVGDFSGPVRQLSIAPGAGERGLAACGFRGAAERPRAETPGTASGLAVQAADDRDMTRRARISRSI